MSVWFIATATAIFAVMTWLVFLNASRINRWLCVFVLAGSWILNTTNAVQYGEQQGREACESEQTPTERYLDSQKKIYERYLMARILKQDGDKSQ